MLLVDVDKPRYDYQLIILRWLLSTLIMQCSVHSHDSRGVACAVYFMRSNIDLCKFMLV